MKDNEEDTHIHRYTHLYFVDDLKFTPLYIREKYKWNIDRALVLSITTKFTSLVKKKQKQKIVTSVRQIVNTKLAFHPSIN